MTELSNTAERVNRDLTYLSALLQQYYKSQAQSWDGKDVEFVRIWDLYKDLRESLIGIDESLFSKLRIIERPQPDDNAFMPNGCYTRKHIDGIINEINLATEYFELYMKTIVKSSENFSLDESLRILTSRFGKVVRQLRQRYNNRTTIEIEDEYDMQDLFHSLLYLFFEDVRAEEWVPSYAGGASRMDFLLKKEKVSIELKKTRKSLDANELGKQLIVDIEKYKEHPDVNNLICFVYDPEFWIANPKGIENDLSNDSDNFRVEVIIEPK
jgi:hypothetical protein